MSWISDEFHKLGHFADTTWDHNRNFLGNLAKNVSPLLSFTPLGPLGSGVLAGLGEAAEKGSNLGDILKAGASNAAIGAGAHSAYGLARGALASGGSAAGNVAPSGSNFAAGAANAAPAPPIPGGFAPIDGSGIQAAATGPSVAPASGFGYLDGSAVHAAALPAAQQAAGKSLSARLLAGLGRNATTIGSAANGVLNARQQGAELDFQKQQYADEQARRARIAAILGPLYQQLQARQGTPVANPYLTHPYTPGGG